MAKPENIKLPASQLAWFCYRLSLALKAGIPVVEAILLIAEDEQNSGQKLGEIAEDVRSGMHLHQALSQHPMFPPYLISMVKLGENTGTLDKITESLAAYYEYESNLRNEVKEALVYPLILICMVGAVVVLVISKILPVFDDILVSVGAGMPAIANTLMHIGLFIKNNSWLPAAIVALLPAGWLFNSTPLGKKQFDKVKARTTLLHGVFQKLYMARVSTVMYYVLASGLNIDSALEMSAEVVGNDYVAEQIRLWRKEVGQGADLVESLNLARVFPGRFSNMIQIAHKAGELPSMSRKIASMCNNEVGRALQKIVSAIEPTLVAILSIIIGTVLIAVMLPLMQIMSSMG